VQAVRRALETRGIRAKGAKRGPPAPKVVAKLPKIRIGRIMCKECGKKLEVTPWNNATNMAYCDNFECQAFRRPVTHPRLRIESEVSYA